MSDQTIRIGQELVRQKLATIDQIRECLATQEELRRDGRHVPIGHLLVARGMIKLEDLKECLSRLSLLALYCPSCVKQVEVRGYSRDNQYLCNDCDSELIFATTRRQDDSDPDPEPRPSRAMPDDGAVGDDALVGRTVGGCVIRRKVASGGMGTVYEAEQVNLGRKVAFKVLADELAKDEVFVKRFLQEARAAAELNHTNIIHINDSGQEDGVFFYTMEFVEGENLNQMLRKRGHFPLDEALDITAQVADALEHAHRKDIIHRDIKPENIMITPAGKVKLADLGLAKKVMGGTHADLTMTGAILGTPYYMAPEQAKDFAHATALSDLYSLGVTLYKMLTDELPFTGSSPIEVMLRAMQGKKKSVREHQPDVPDEVSDLVDCMMHVDPARRPGTAGQLRDEVRDLLKRRRVRG